MKIKKFLFVITTMFLMVQGASAWNGSGSSGDPYLIASPADWETLATSTDEYSDTFFKLTADITVTTMRTKTFSGTFDGGGHTLTFNYTATGDNAALFAYITGATIKNLRVAGTITTSKQFAAGIVAISNGGSIENCRSSVTIDSSTSGDGTHGGLVADSYQGRLDINNCLFDGKLLGKNTTNCGGIVGWHKQGTLNITNTLFAPAEVTVQVQGGAIFARNGATSLNHCYYISDWSAATVQGTNANSMTTAALVTALNNGGTNWCNNGGNATPILIFDYIGNQSNWNAFTSGINAGINYSGKTVKMSADFTATTMATSTFKGTFDGGGHTLTFNYTATDEKVAPFRYINGATIKNLRVAGTINTGYKFAAGIVAISDGGTITNCQSSVTINSSKSGDGTHGGLVADSYTGTLNITNCLFDGKLLGTTTTSCGGIVGWHNSNSTLNISNSLFAPAEVTVQGGAIFARDGANSLSNCYYISDWAAATVQGTNANSMTAAALVTALNNGDKNWCVHRGNAIPVMVNLVINNKTEWDNFSSHAGNYENKYVQLNADITNITAMTSGTFQGIFDGNGHTLTVNISGGGNVAPFQNLNGGTIMNLTVTGTVTGGANYCSGLVARTTGGVCLIDNCVVNTNNTGVGFVGGVVAHADNATSLTISNCIYGGTIAIQPNGNDNYSGGIFGWYNNNKTLDLVMTNCLFKGDYTGNGQFHPIGVKKWAGIFKSINCTNCYYTKNPANIDGPDRFFTDGTKVSELTIGTTGVSIASGSYATFQGTKYYYGTITLDYNGPMATTNFSLDGTHLDDNSFTISTDNAAFDDGTATINARCSISKSISAYTQGGHDGWYLIASPFLSVTPSTENGFITNTYDLFRFNQNPEQNDAGNYLEWENWNEPNSGNINHYHFNLEPGRGYLYANNTNVTLTFVGTPYSGSGQVTLVRSSSNGNTDGRMLGWNLIGNPFGESKTIGQAFYRMNNDHTDLIASTDDIAPMEGVFVYRDAQNGPESVTFTTSGAKGNESHANNIVINLSGNASTPSTGSGTGSATAVIDRAIVSFEEGRTLPKFQINENSTKLYIPQNGADYAIAFSDRTGEIPLNFKAAKNGSYTLTVELENAEMGYLHLIDNMTGADVDLLVQPSYTFTSRTTDYESRFRLVFSANGPSTGSGTDEPFAFYANGEWIVLNEGEATLQVIDIIGRQLLSEKAYSEFRIPNSAFSTSGVYILRLINGDSVRTQKIVVR